jgi:hypothetical protein
MPANPDRSSSRFTSPTQIQRIIVAALLLSGALTVPAHSNPAPSVYVEVPAGNIVVPDGQHATPRPPVSDPFGATWSQAPLMGSEAPAGA